MGKRAKTTTTTREKDDDDDDDVVDDRFAATFDEDDDDGTDDETNANANENEEEVAAVVKPTKTLDAAALERVRKDHARRGVVFLGTIPPFMKPTKLRQLLNEYGETDRMYLAPEDPAIRAKRKKFGGNTGKKFVEGWVEFRNKKHAKKAAEMLHGRQVGGKRRSAHYYDLWNIRYLPKFKWDNLTEEMEYQKALREKKIQLELAVAKKERDFYIEKMDQAKALEAMKERRAKRRAAEGAADDETEEEALERYKREKEAEDKEEKKRIMRTFKQKAAQDPDFVDETKELANLDLLKSIFT
jgi:ESF2/ABP1 family protein